MIRLMEWAEFGAAGVRWMEGDRGGGESENPNTILEMVAWRLGWRVYRDPGRACCLSGPVWTGEAGERRAEQFGPACSLGNAGRNAGAVAQLVEPHRSQ